PLAGPADKLSGLGIVVVSAARLFGCCVRPWLANDRRGLLLSFPPAALLAPPRGGALVSPCLRQFDQPVEGFVQPARAPRRGRHPRRPRPHPPVARAQQRLGLGVLLLPQQRAAEQRLGLERPPVSGRDLLPDRQALAEDRLSLGALALL